MSDTDRTADGAEYARKIHEQDERGFIASLVNRDAGPSPEMAMTFVYFGVGREVERRGYDDANAAAFLLGVVEYIAEAQKAGRG